MADPRIQALLDKIDQWEPGAITTVDWFRVPWADGIAAGVYGDVVVVASEDALGFTMRGGDHANWLAIVRGPAGTIHVIPGCKIRTITYGADFDNREYVAVP